MSSKTKFPRSLALGAARELCNLLKPFCEPDRLIVAGSLRRRKEEVGDVEILYIPRFLIVAPEADLFAPKWVREDTTTIQLNELIKNGVLRKRLNANASATWAQKTNTPFT